MNHELLTTQLYRKITKNYYIRQPFLLNQRYYNKHEAIQATKCLAAARRAGLPNQQLATNNQQLKI